MKKLQILALTMLFSTPVMLVPSSGRAMNKVGQMQSSLNAKFSTLSSADQAAIKLCQQAASDVLNKSQALNESVKAGLQAVDKALAISGVSDSERTKLLNFQNGLQNLQGNLANTISNKKMFAMSALPNLLN